MSYTIQNRLHTLLALLVLLPGLLVGRILIQQTTVSTTQTTILVTSPDEFSPKNQALPNYFAVPENQEQILVRYLFFLPMVC